jgi:protein-S-isoprenylcysteine O-methyltransferase Ste14
MKTAFFALVILSETLLVASLVITILQPQARVWPPPGRNSWQYRFTWGLASVALGGAACLGFLDYDTFVIPHWLRAPIGGALMLAGLSFALWGLRTLGVHASLGLGGELVSRGPYRCSRNPEYVGDIALILGYALVCNSALVLASALLGAAWFLLAPFAEEPWLRERFGPEYDAYRRNVPRFLGFPHSTGPRRNRDGNGMAR